MPEFKVNIDLGHILTIGILLVTIGVSYGSLSAVRDKVSETVVKLEAVSVQLGDMRQKQAEMDGRLRTVEKQLDRQFDEQLAGKPARPVIQRAQ